MIRAHIHSIHPARPLRAGVSTASRLACSGLAAATIAAIAASSAADAQSPATTGETTLSVAEGHVLLTPIDAKTGRLLDEQQIIVATGQKALMSPGEVPLIAIMAAAERAQLNAQIGRLRALAPAAADRRDEPTASRRHEPMANRPHEPTANREPSRERGIAREEKARNERAPAERVERSHAEKGHQKNEEPDRGRGEGRKR